MSVPAWFKPFVIGIFATIAALSPTPAAKSGENAAIPASSAAGLNFVLTDHRGIEVTPDTLAGRPYLVFFGFTNCPDICPTTLMEIGALLDGLGPLASDITPLFVTLDPERDTVAQLALYLSAFDRRIVGLTGSRADVEQMAATLGARHRRVPQGTAYTIDHAIFSYLVDSSGTPLGPVLIGHGAPMPRALDRIRAVISAPRATASRSDARTSRR